MQDMKNRQNSIKIDFEDDKNRQLAYQWEVLQNSIIEKVNNAYGWALDHGIAKEQARAILPEGMTVSRMYMNGTLRSWVHYIQLRTEKGTQKEHREVALECANVIENIFPMIKEFVSV
jgi:thymidylate synthase (FAD)